MGWDPFAMADNGQIGESLGEEQSATISQVHNLSLSLYVRFETRGHRMLCGFWRSHRRVRRCHLDREKQLSLVC